ncbi:MAG: hypothetical protein AB7G93_21265 [Bdellovibrionales bacterium]
MPRIFLFLLLILQVASPLARAGYDKEVVNALATGDLAKAESLLGHPPEQPAQPLKGGIDSAGIVYLFFFILQEHTEASEIERIINMLRRAIRLGADPTRIVVFEGPSPYGFDLSPVEIILHEWETESKKTPDSKSASIIRSARKMFDIFFETKAVSPNYQLLFAFSKDDTRRLGFIHWLVLRQASQEIRSYFLSQGVGPSSMDDAMWNMAMVAAGSADLEVLRDIRQHCGQVAAAGMFNYRCPINYNPTVLHAALMPLVGGTPAERVIEVIEYLVQNGANPSQRSRFHDLIDELDFWEPQYPQHRKEFSRVRAYLREHLDRLQTEYEHAQHCLRALGVTPEPPGYH